MLIKPYLSVILLSGIILAVVSGCDTRFKAESVLNNYVTDLNRSQYLSISSPARLMPQSLPLARDRRQTLSEFDIGLLDFLSLQQCDVGIVAGRKNSILGKVMPDSQRFLYELDIIRAIESCEIQDEKLSEKLKKVARKKRLELPMAYGNALFSGSESDAFFSLSNGFLPLDFSTVKQQSLLSSLNRFVEIGENLENLPIVDANIFEEDLKVLMNSEYAGRLLYSLSRISEYLALVANSVGKLNKTVCGPPMVYLKQQFDMSYVKVIQPYMGRINASAYQILPLLNRIAELSAPLSYKMNVFLKQFSLTDPSSKWKHYQQMSQRHAKAWSAFFGECSVPITSYNR
ncbi:DUF3080 domain-containing protein [Marinomonas sp. CT5]|uniref:DUF3080 family protein n=1 Tax=Marinomonas sp. CT5 TaxID=2066133 RepID=UPI001BB0BD00|nr:DUF3080 family protein [Marinomonas sp. CT5]QUX94675.1 DUF3080 domain-containing protein [Marinomonas sp. CT5]